MLPDEWSYDLHTENTKNQTESSSSRQQYPPAVDYRTVFTAPTHTAATTNNIYRDIQTPQQQLQTTLISPQHTHMMTQQFPRYTSTMAHSNIQTNTQQTPMMTQQLFSRPNIPTAHQATLASAPTQP